MGAGGCVRFFTCSVDVTSAVQCAAEQLETDDGVDNNNEQNQQRDVK